MRRNKTVFLASGNSCMQAIPKTLLQVIPKTLGSPSKKPKLKANSTLPNFRSTY